MNADALRLAGEHVQEEHRKLRDLNGALDRALELAVNAFLNGTEREDLPGTPPMADAGTLAWLEYFVAQGALVYHEPLFEAGV